MLKFQNEVCQCGLNLSNASPLDEIFKKDETGKVVTFWACPKCGCANPTIEVADIVTPPVASEETEAPGPPVEEPSGPPAEKASKFKGARKGGTA